MKLKKAIFLGVTGIILFEIVTFAILSLIVDADFACYVLPWINIGISVLFIVMSIFINMDTIRMMRM